MASNPPLRDGTAGLDTPAIVALTGVGEITLNSWIRRKLIPNLAVGTQGRARVFDLDATLHLATMAALTQGGFAAAIASRAAIAARGGYDSANAILVIGVRNGVADISLFSSITPHPTGWYLDALAEVGDWDSRPSVYTIVDLGRIAEDVKKFLANLAEKRA